MSDSPIIDDLIKNIHDEAGASGMVAVLQALRNLNVYEMEDQVGVGDGKGLPHPMPMAFADAWREVFDLLLSEANKPRVLR